MFRAGDKTYNLCLSPLSALEQTTPMPDRFGSSSAALEPGSAMLFFSFFINLE